MTNNTDPVRAQAWAKLEREWCIDGMPADKIRLARAAFDAGAALASAPPTEVRALIEKWRSESTSDDQSSDYECGEHSARSECADELEAALAARQPAGVGEEE